MILLIDNYDSFTFLLKDYLLQCNLKVEVLRNDEIDGESVFKKNPEAIVFSPGPKTPLDAGNLMQIIEASKYTIPLLGICLGHQAIAISFGATLSLALKPMHGKTSTINCTAHPLFENIPETFSVMRYHSLVIHDIEKTLLQPIAKTVDGELMAFVHPEKKIAGIQFHPESILTQHGLQLIKNWSAWYKL